MPVRKLVSQALTVSLLIQSVICLYLTLTAKVRMMAMVNYKLASQVLIVSMLIPKVISLFQASIPETRL